MNWTLIIIGVLAFLVALKFIKTIGKIVFFVITLVAVFAVCIGVFGINPIDYVIGLIK